MISEVLRDKIRKLLNMAELGTGNEAEVAMAKVQELMQSHGITKDDVNLFTVDIPAPKRKAKWLLMLATLCGDFSGVACFGMSKFFTFAGDEIGVNVASELFIYLNNEIKRLLEKYKIKGLKNRNDFRIGCLAGVEDKLQKLGGWRDMQEKIERLHKRHFANVRIKKLRKVGVDKYTYLRGKEIGTSININRQAGVDARAGYIE